jgi:hypothetical protein
LIEFGETAIPLSAHLGKTRHTDRKRMSISHCPQSLAHSPELVEPPDRPHQSQFPITISRSCGTRDPWSRCASFSLNISARFPLPFW